MENYFKKMVGASLAIGFLGIAYSFFSKQKNYFPIVDPDSPQAKEIGYTHDATTVDGAKFSYYKPGQVLSDNILWEPSEKCPPGYGMLKGGFFFNKQCVCAKGWADIF